MICIKNGKLVCIDTSQIIQTGDLYPIETVSNFVLMSDHKLYGVYDSFSTDTCCVKLLSCKPNDYIVEKIYDRRETKNRIIIKTNIGYYLIDAHIHWGYKINDIDTNLDLSTIFYEGKIILYIDTNGYCCFNLSISPNNKFVKRVDSDVITIISYNISSSTINIVYQNNKLQIISKTFSCESRETNGTQTYTKIDTILCTTNITFPIGKICGSYTISDGKLYCITLDDNNNCIANSYNQADTYFVDTRLYNNGSILVVDDIGNIINIKFSTTTTTTNVNDEQLLRDVIAIGASFKMTFSRTKSAASILI